MSGGRAVTRANRVGVEQACLAAKKTMIASAVASGMPPPGTRGLRGFNKGKGTTWNVRYNVKGYRNPVGMVRFTGPVHLMNNGTKPHWIAARNTAWGGRTSARTGNLVGAGKGAHALYFPDGEVRNIPVFHPGTKGKKFFEKAEPIVGVQSKRIIEREINAHLASVFTGKAA